MNGTWRVADKGRDWVAWQNEDSHGLVYGFAYVCVDIMPLGFRQTQVWRVICNGEEEELPKNWCYP